MKHIIVFAILVANTNGIEWKQSVRYRHLEVLVDELQSLDWQSEETPCLDRLMRIVKNVRNSTLWATWIWDSMQVPFGQLYGNTNHYGNYDECVDFPWKQLQPDLRTQYCLTNIRLSDIKPEVKSLNLLGHDNVLDYIKTETKFGLKFNNLRWGVCVPAVCQPRAVIKFVSVLFRHTHFGLTVDEPYNITIDVCETAGKSADDRRILSYICWFFMAFGVFTTICISMYVDNKGLAIKSPGQVQEYLKAFHIPTNARSLVKITDDDIRSVYGIRFISFLIAIYTHTYLVLSMAGVSNGYRLEQDFEVKRFKTLGGTESVVDTFLFLSGLFLMRTLMRDMSKPFNPLKVILKRYLRLAWPLAIVLLLFIVLWSSNPMLYRHFNVEIEVCKKYWWRNFLMIDNYVDPENMCYAITWSTICDFHLSVLGTLMFWVLKKNRRTALLIYLAVLIAAIAAPGIYFYNSREPPVIMGFFKFVGNYRKQAISDPLYVYTHFRAGSYLVGIAFGYLMSVYNPSNYRNVLSVKQSIVCFVGFLALLMGYIIILFIVSEPMYNLLGGAIYVALKRVFWAISIGILVSICEYGNLPVVSNFLGWSAFAPFNRLSYGIYLGHVIFLLVGMNIHKNPLFYSLYQFLLIGTGISAFAAIFSLVLWIFFDAPMQNIVSLLLRNRVKPNLQEFIQNGKQTHKEMNGKQH